MRDIRYLSLISLIAAGTLAACQKPAPDAEPAAQAPTPAPAPVPAPGSQPSTPPMSANTVEVRLDRTTYASRATVNLSIANRTTRTLGYNACTRQVEREANGSWTAVPEPDRVCTMALRILSPNETATDMTDLPQLQPRRYRLALNFSDEGASEGPPIRALSAPFDVR